MTKTKDSDNINNNEFRKVGDITMNQKLKNIIKIILCVFMIVALIFSFVISQDQHHLTTCHETECSECTMIHVAQAIIQIAFSICVCFVMSFLIHYVLSRIHNNEKICVKKSPIFLKIQLNE